MSIRFLIVLTLLVIVVAVAAASIHYVVTTVSPFCDIPQYSDRTTSVMKCISSNSLG
jgi:hypothetical protein